MRTEIFINEQSIDVGSEPIALNYSIADINKIQSRSTDFSRTITVPATSTNQQVFGFATDINSLSAKDQTQLLKARIEVNGIVVMTGLCKVKSIVSDPFGVLSEYKIEIKGGNGDWKESMNELELIDVDLSEGDHAYTKANITASWTNDYTDLYTYPLTNYGYEHIGNDAIKKQFTLNDFYPAVFVKPVFDKIFNDAGYQVISSFTNTNFFKKLIIPFTKEKFSNGSDEDLYLKAYKTSTDGVSFGAPYAGYGYSTSTDLIWEQADQRATDPPYALGTGHYTCKKDIHLKVSSRLFLLDIADTPRVRYSLIKKLNGTSTEVVLKKGIEELSGADEHYVGLDYEGSFENGDEIYVRVAMDTPNIDDGVCRIETDSEFIITPTNKIPFGATIELSKQLPDMTQLEFVQMLKEHFNLYFYTDVNEKKIYIEPHPDFFSNISESVDWSDKLDVSKPPEISYISVAKKTFIYTQKPDSGDVLLEEYEKEKEAIYGEHKVDVKNVFANGEQKVEVKAVSPTIMREDTARGLGNTLIPTLWKDLPEDDNVPDRNIKFNTRMWYYDGENSTEGTNSFKIIDEDGNETSNAEYGAAFTGYTTDGAMQFADVGGELGFYQKYYGLQQKLYDESRILKANFHLTPLDIANLNPRKLIKLGENFYYINKISNYTPGASNTTTVELLLYVGNYVPVTS